METRYRVKSTDGTIKYYNSCREIAEDINGCGNTINFCVLAHITYRDYVITREVKKYDAYTEDGKLICKDADLTELAKKTNYERKYLWRVFNEGRTIKTLTIVKRWETV